MDNQEEKKLKIKTKAGVGTQIGIGIAILAIIVGGGGIVAYLMFPPAKPVTQVCDPPSSFDLLTPANTAEDQDDDVTLTWEVSTPATTPAITYKVASLGGVSYKLAGITINYKVYLGTSATDMTQIATVSGTSYTATDLMVGTTYYWKVQAYNSCGTKYSSTWSFSTAGIDWLLEQGYLEPLPEEAAACGGNQECDDDDILSCAEWNDVWLACNGIGNKCPDNLEEQCLQMTICQCSGVPPGSPACTEFLASFTDPCGY